MTLKGNRILVVEDDPFIALDVADNLARAGATVVGPAHNLLAALRLAEDADLAAAVLDFRLEHGDTLAVAARLAERGIPFVFQTSDPEAVRRSRPEALILSKPVPAETLIRALEKLL